MAGKKNISTVVNKAEKLPPSSDIRNYPKIPTQLYRITTNMDLLKNAILAAENIIIPQRYLLYQQYNMIDLDPHLTAVKQQRKNLTLGKKFCVYNPDGSENEEKTTLIRKKWFRDFLDLALESQYWGHTLIQFESIIEMNGQDEFKGVDMVPRIFVKPEFHIVTQDYASFVGADYLDSPYNAWVIGVGKPRDLGLYLKAAPLVIWKKNAMGAWAEFAEKFGTPIMTGKTDIRNEKSRDNMYQWFKNMRANSFGVFDINDLIELVETGQQDAFNVYNEMINRCNSELSKLFLGQTGTTDEKSFVGSAEVHERILDSYAELDEHFIDGVLNYQLAPMLNMHGFGFEGLRIAAEAEDEFTLDQKSKFDIELIKTGRFTMTKEYIKEKYGTEVIEVKEEVQPDKSAGYKNRMEFYYK